MFYCDNLKIRDKYGRERIFRGINICAKSHIANKFLVHKALFKEGIFEDMKSIGVNIVRLGITWAAIEPHEGKYNDDLISLLKEFIGKCAEHNIYVMFDMHQDLFSHHFHGDGAPKWAIEPSYSNPRQFAIWAEGYSICKVFRMLFMISGLIATAYKLSLLKCGLMLPTHSKTAKT